MNKLKMMQVTGEAGEYTIDIKRLVTVLNETEFAAMVRLQVMKEAQKYMLTEEQQADLIGSLRVRFLETGLDEYPSDNTTVAEIYRDFLADGPSTVPNTKNAREGIVITADNQRYVRGLGRVQLKLVSNKFLEGDNK